MVIGSSNPTLIPGYVKGADGPGGFYLNYGMYSNAVETDAGYVRMKIYMKQLA
jgi:hypothetical protein